jgi:chemotaxis protein MotB
MHFAHKKTIAVIVCLASITLTSGCTNWKEEHDKLLSINKNLEGQLALESALSGDRGEQLSLKEQTILDLQRQIEELNQSPSKVTGFEGDVTFDAAAGTITVTLPNQILFSSGAAELKTASSRELNNIESVLQSKYPGKNIDVVGHTDSEQIKMSGWKDNWELSAERALAVTRYLIKRGVPDDQIRAVGCGEARPVVPNTSAANKAKNRRVEIVVYMR